MRFEPTRISSFSQQSFSWKQFFSTGRMKIKTLLSDVFEKSSNNKEVTKKVYISRGLPNSVGAEDEVYNATFGRFEFYPEDIEKMSTMSREESRKFKKELIFAKRYIEYPDD